MKKIISLTLIITMLFTVQIAFASKLNYSSSQIDSVEVEYLEDGNKYVTVIETVSEPVSISESSLSASPLASTKTETKSKTVYYQNADGDNLWYVKVTGTFTYGNGTSTCTASTPSAGSYNSAWKVSNISGSKSGNKASTTATGKQYSGGLVVLSKTKTVTLTCSSTGVFS